MTVPKGSMVLHDRIDPPLVQGRYEVEVATTDPTFAAAPLPSHRRWLDVRGPRFQLPPAEVAGVFPPRNGHGAFVDALPHVALGRRTLPWERPLDPAGALPPAPARPAGEPPAPTGTPPWMALLLLEEAEVLELVQDAPVADVLPASILAALAVPEGERCAYVGVAPAVASGVLPTVEELHLLTHVREVNVDDRELAAGDSDGFFAVVMGNRIPQAGRKYRACLVSVEGRTDLLQVAEPPVEAPRGDLVVELLPAAGFATASPAVHAQALDLAGAFWVPLQVRPTRLVLLHSWTFECEGRATFEGLCRALDVGLFGEVRGDWPKVADTGHLPIDLRDRAGAAQKAWYRGPLAPFPVTRDERGPYHSADQCRRVSPETGMEDLSYAAAFEVGRLLAASDARLAQELMRWRRVDFRRSVERSVLDGLRARLPGLPLRVDLLLAGLAAELVRPWLDPRIPRSDPLEWQTIASAPGLRPDLVAAAWGIEREAAAQVLAAGPEALAAGVEVVGRDERPSGSLAAVLGDLAGLARLGAGRRSFLEMGLQDGIGRER